MPEVDPLIFALVPAFAAGFAIQQFLELIDPIIAKFVKNANKKIVLSIISLVLGIVIVSITPIRIFDGFGYKLHVIDGAITALFISAGTEGLNSIVKFLGYAKEKEKADASNTKATVESDTGARTQMLKLNREKQ